MRVFENLEPKEVFYYFEEICKIPHGSYNTRAISNYLAGFAKEHGLFCRQDEIGNIIMIKEASKGYEDHEPVMLQGHMDMVAVKKPDCDIDMKTEGLRIAVDGDNVYAEGTSLGGDDGIAVAYGLALMAGDYKHPRIELIITVDEEVGMDGAKAINLSDCRAKRMINIDSEEEGFFLAGCAGGASVNLTGDFEEKPADGVSACIHVTGLQGGHSGAEIDKERASAVIVLGRALARLKDESISCRIQSLDSGMADNAISREATAIVVFENQQEKVRAAKVLSELTKGLLEEYAQKDPDILVEVTDKDGACSKALTEEESLRLTHLLTVLPYGVQAMSSEMQGLVETSLNPGILKLQDGALSIAISVRSSIESAKVALIDKLKAIAALAGVTATVRGDYPGFAYKQDSPLCHTMSDVYEKMVGEKPVVTAIHAGLEIGFFAGVLPGLDCVSIGPDMKNIHTTEETLSISSTERVWKFLLALLEEL